MCVHVCAAYRAISGIDCVVGFSILCILKLPIDETLVGHLQFHVIDVFSCLEMATNTKKYSLQHAMPCLIIR